ncbi:hypothetical protein HZA97_03315 [Candidatus Woesearchaeota archaeon]|nr:hypothetical protein [Candidatus Woesearchaeota archaeon]
MHPAIHHIMFHSRGSHRRHGASSGNNEQETESTVQSDETGSGKQKTPFNKQVNNKGLSVLEKTLMAAGTLLLGTVLAYPFVTTTVEKGKFGVKHTQENVSAVAPGVYLSIPGFSEVKAIPAKLEISDEASALLADGTVVNYKYNLVCDLASSLSSATDEGQELPNSLFLELFCDPSTETLKQNYIKPRLTESLSRYLSLLQTSEFYDSALRKAKVREGTEEFYTVLKSVGINISSLVIGSYTSSADEIFRAKNEAQKQLDAAENDAAQYDKNQNNGGK